MKIGKALIAVSLTIIGVILLGTFALITTVNQAHEKSKREIVKLVSEFKPGVSFEAVKIHLGKPSQVFTNAHDIEIMGTTHDKSIPSNSVLHLLSIVQFLAGGY